MTQLDTALIQITNLCVRKGSVTLLEGIGFAVTAGEIMAVVGPNGAGKSTLVSSLMAPPSTRAGDVIFNHRQWDSYRSRELAQHVAILPQQSQLNFPFRTEEVVQLGRTPHSSGNKRDKKIVAEVMQALDIEYLCRRCYTDLSGGEKQRTQLARVFAQIWPVAGMNEQRLLILDEPSAALDIAHKQSLLHSVNHLAKTGVAVIWVEHDLNLVVQFADKLLAVKHGKVAAYGETDVCLNRELVNSLYGAEVDFVVNPKNGKRVMSL